MYPELLLWTEKIQTSLSKPFLLNNYDTLYKNTSKNIIVLRFSESMKKVDNFDIVLHFGQWDKEVVNINKANVLKWDKEGKSLSFELELPQKEVYYLLLNWWGVKNPVISNKGVTLQATNGLIVKGGSSK